MIKTLKHSIKNPLDTLFNAFNNDKNNKNVSPYNGIYKLIQAHRQAQKEKPYTCINKSKRLHYSPILHGLEQNKQYKNTSKKQKVCTKKKNSQYKSIPIHTYVF